MASARTLHRASRRAGWARCMAGWWEYTTGRAIEPPRAPVGAIAGKNAKPGA